MFVPVEIDEALKMMPKSIHRHSFLAEQKLRNGEQFAYKFKELFVVFEPCGDTLMVQCVEGAGLNDNFLSALYKCAINNGFSFITFVTPHKSMPRIVKKLHPSRVDTYYECELKKVTEL